MLFVKIPKEIGDYEPKLFGQLTIRQLKWSAIAITVGGGTYFIGHFIIPDNILSWVVIIVVVIPFMCGFVRIQNMPADDYMKMTLDYINKSSIDLRYDDGSDGKEITDAFIQKSKKTRKLIEKDRKQIKKIGENQ